jgi:DNA-directed RNA polymerase sigma subunit (sigma70/sigma32)
MANRDDNVPDDVQRILDRLSPREREVVETRFGIGKSVDVQWQAVRAHLLSLTRKRIGEIEKRALDKLGSRGDPDDAA